MKAKILPVILIVATLLTFSKVNFAQTINLGTAANFVLFTGAGAIGNTGTSSFVGDIGSDVGAITGFIIPTTVIGTIYMPGVVTAQATIDLQAAHDQLIAIPATNTSHLPVYGSILGETLQPGVYEQAAAGSLNGILNLDAEGNPFAVFIFRFGGSFTTTAGATVNLLNGAQAGNVYWVAEGAIPMAASTTMKGTVIASNGAAGMAAGGNLEGRIFSTGIAPGALDFGPGTATVPTLIILPVNLVSFTGICEKQKVVLKWSTTSEINSKNFTVERSDEAISWQPVGTVVAAGNSSYMHSYTLTDNISVAKPIAYYRLKQTDINGNYKYGNTIVVRECGTGGAENLTLYPNPSDGKFDLLFTGDIATIRSTEIFNSMGEKVYESIGSQTKFDLSNKTAGIYFVHVHLRSETIVRKIIIKK